MNKANTYFWGLLSRFAPQAVYLLTTMILSRFLTPADFGTIGVLAIIFSVANILLDSGLGGSLIQKKEITSIDCSTISVFNLGVALIIYLCLFLSASQLEGYFEICGLSNVIKTISLVFPITAFAIVPLSLLKRNLAFKEIFISTITGVSVASIISICIAISGFGVYALVAYQIFVNLISVALNFYFSKYKLSFVFSIDSFKNLIPFGFFTSVVTIIDAVYENLITTLTGKFLDVSKAGYLYQAKRIEETMSTSLASAVGIVAFPILTRLRDDLDLFVHESLKTFKTITLSVFPLLMIVSIFSKQILVLMFGTQWIPAAPYLKILMICGFFILMEQLLLSFIKSLGEVRNLMNITILKRIIGIILLLFSLVINGDLLVYAYLLSTFVGFCLNFHLFYRITKINIIYFTKNILISLLPVATMYAIISVTEYLSTSIVIPIFVTVIMFIVYYFPFLKSQGINILNYVDVIRKK